MSSLPGLTLERYLMWNLDLVVDGDLDANPSLRIAEALGHETRRDWLTTEQFAPILAMFEPYRAYVENQLEDFDKETQSWRDYAGYAFSSIPEERWTEAFALIKALKE